MSKFKLSYDTNSEGDSVTPCKHKTFTGIGSDECIKCSHFVSIAKGKKMVICGYAIEISNTPKQIGGTHYEKMKIQPIEFIEENDLGFHVGNAIKYICRYEDKNGIQDIDKAIDYLNRLKRKIENESKLSK